MLNNQDRSSDRGRLWRKAWLDSPRSTKVSFEAVRFEIPRSVGPTAAETPAPDAEAASPSFEALPLLFDFSIISLD